jgi:hypothetical protein
MFNKFYKNGGTMDYLNKINEIEKSMQEKNKIIFETIEEANENMLKYETLMDEIINVITNLLKNNEIEQKTKEIICTQALILLANNIGCANYDEKYGNIIDKLFTENKITEKQFNIFNENLNLGRWM